jgi:hypothetical protein
MTNLKLIVLTNKQILLSQIDEVGSELGEPDCRLNKPLLIDGENLVSWFGEYTDQEEFMIHSDKILTIAEPKKNLVDKYESFKH